MAFENKHYDFKLLLLVLIGLPVIASTNIDCGGKSFHCLNSTHFMICVDLGNGVSTTVDDFVIPCPPPTVCVRTNRFECEFPKPITTTSTTVSPVITTTLDSTTRHTTQRQLVANEVVTFGPLVFYENEPEPMTTSMPIPDLFLTETVTYSNTTDSPNSYTEQNALNVTQPDVIVNDTQMTINSKTTKVQEQHLEVSTVTTNQGLTTDITNTPYTEIFRVDLMPDYGMDMQFIEDISTTEGSEAVTVILNQDFPTDKDITNTPTEISNTSSFGDSLTSPIPEKHTEVLGIDINQKDTSLNTNETINQEMFTTTPISEPYTEHTLTVPLNQETVTDVTAGVQYPQSSEGYSTTSSPERYTEFMVIDLNHDAVSEIPANDTQFINDDLGKSDSIKQIESTTEVFRKNDTTDVPLSLNSMLVIDSSTTFIPEKYMDIQATETILDAVSDNFVNIGDKQLSKEISTRTNTAVFQNTNKSEVDATTEQNSTTGSTIIDSSTTLIPKKHTAVQTTEIIVDDVTDTPMKITDTQLVKEISTKSTMGVVQNTNKSEANVSTEKQHLAPFTTITDSSTTLIPEKHTVVQMTETNLDAVTDTPLKIANTQFLKKKITESEGLNTNKSEVRDSTEKQNLAPDGTITNSLTTLIPEKHSDVQTTETNLDVFTDTPLKIADTQFVKEISTETTTRLNTNKSEVRASTEKENLAPDGTITNSSATRISEKHMDVHTTETILDAVTDNFLNKDDAIPVKEIPATSTTIVVLNSNTSELRISTENQYTTTDTSITNSLFVPKKHPDVQTTETILEAATETAMNKGGIIIDKEIPTTSAMGVVRNTNKSEVRGSTEKLHLESYSSTTLMPEKSITDVLTTEIILDAVTDTSLNIVNTQVVEEIPTISPATIYLNLNRSEVRNSTVNRNSITNIPTKDSSIVLITEKYTNVQMTEIILDAVTNASLNISNTHFAEEISTISTTETGLNSNRSEVKTSTANKDAAADISSQVNNVQTKAKQSATSFQTQTTEDIWRDVETEQPIMFNDIIGVETTTIIEMQLDPVLKNVVKEMESNATTPILDPHIDIETVKVIELTTQSSAIIYDNTHKTETQTSAPDSYPFWESTTENFKELAVTNPLTVNYNNSSEFISEQRLEVNTIIIMQDATTEAPEITNQGHIIEKENKINVSSEIRQNVQMDNSKAPAKDEIISLTVPSVVDQNLEVIAPDTFADDFINVLRIVSNGTQSFLDTNLINITAVINQVETKSNVTEPELTVVHTIDKPITLAQENITTIQPITKNKTEYVNHTDSHQITEIPSSISSQSALAKGNNDSKTVNETKFNNTQNVINTTIVTAAIEKRFPVKDVQTIATTETLNITTIKVNKTDNNIFSDTTNNLDERNVTKDESNSTAAPFDNYLSKTEKKYIVTEPTTPKLINVSENTNIKNSVSIVSSTYSGTNSLGSAFTTFVPKNNKSHGNQIIADNPLPVVTEIASADFDYTDNIDTLNTAFHWNNTESTTIWDKNESTIIWDGAESTTSWDQEPSISITENIVIVSSQKNFKRDSEIIKALDTVLAKNIDLDSGSTTENIVNVPSNKLDNKNILAIATDESNKFSDMNYLVESVLNVSSTHQIFETTDSTVYSTIITPEIRKPLIVSIDIDKPSNKTYINTSEILKHVTTSPLPVDNFDNSIHLKASDSEPFVFNTTPHIQPSFSLKENKTFANVSDLLKDINGLAEVSIYELLDENTAKVKQENAFSNITSFATAKSSNLYQDINNLAEVAVTDTNNNHEVNDFAVGVIGNPGSNQGFSKNHANCETSPIVAEDNEELTKTNIKASQDDIHLSSGSYNDQTIDKPIQILNPVENFKLARGFTLNKILNSENLGNIIIKTVPSNITESVDTVSTKEGQEGLFIKEINKLAWNPENEVTSDTTKISDSTRKNTNVHLGTNQKGLLNVDINKPVQKSESESLKSKVLQTINPLEHVILNDSLNTETTARILQANTVVHTKPKIILQETSSNAPPETIIESNNENSDGFAVRNSQQENVLVQKLDDNSMFEIKLNIELGSQLSTEQRNGVSVKRENSNYNSEGIMTDSSINKNDNDIVNISNDEFSTKYSNGLEDFSIVTEQTYTAVIPLLTTTTEKKIEDTTVTIQDQTTTSEIVENPSTTESTIGETLTYQPATGQISTIEYATSERSSMTPTSETEASDSTDQYEISTEPTLTFDCQNRPTGRYADEKDCRKFYICSGVPRAIVGMCPANTVFSEFSKQCTKNLSHCVRLNQFKCIFPGRYSDFFKPNMYYICIRKGKSFLKYKFQCQKGFVLNKQTVKCEFKEPEVSSLSISNDNSQSTIEKKSKESKLSKKSKEKPEFECEEEGKFPYKDDCKKYYLCTKKQSSEKFRQRIKKCGSNKIFHKKRRKCIDDDDSYEC